MKLFIISDFEKLQVREDRIQTFLVARDVPAIRLRGENFAAEVFSSSRHYIPILVCVYAWWAPQVVAYLSAFERAAAEFQVF